MRCRPWAASSARWGSPKSWRRTGATTRSGFCWAPRSCSRDLPVAGLDPAVRPTRPAPRRALALAALLGFLGLLAESLWLQLFGFYWESNAETFGLVTAASIGGVSLGSAFGRRLPLWLGAGGLRAGRRPLADRAAGVYVRRASAVTALLVGLPAAGVGAAFAQLLSRDSFPLLAAANAAGAAAAPLLLGLTSTGVGWPARALVGVACGYGLLAGRKPWALIGIVGVALMPGLPPAASYHRRGRDPLRDGPGWSRRSR